MDSGLNEIADILRHCEDNPSLKYQVQDATYLTEKAGFLKSSPVVTNPVNYPSKDEEIFVVSDLHIASGRSEAGVYKGTENFFADDSFGRFLKFANENKKAAKAILVINGDVFDFLRIVEYPGRMRKIKLAKRIKQWLKRSPIRPTERPTEATIQTAFREWSDILASIGIEMSADELKANISSRERTFGLRTNDYKSVWKLNLIRKGHPGFFESIASWIKQGNRLIIVKGNHDTEWYWSAVRNYFRLLLAEALASLSNKDLKQVLVDMVLPNLTFIDDSVVIDNDLYIEHGHRYDKFTVILGKPILLKSSDELNVPFGSFFNRYLINRAELYYPFLDNVRPSANVLPILMRQNFPLALKVLFYHIPYTVYILLKGNGRYIWYMFNRVFWFAAVIVIPLVTILYLNINIVWQYYQKLLGSASGAQSWWLFLTDNLFVNNLKSFGLLFLAYILSRIVSWFQISEPDSLDRPARRIMQNSNYRIATMGHTHNPGSYIFSGNKRFYNTGTWVPVIEISTADVRDDKTYTFLHLIRDPEGKLQPANGGLLQRWDDESSRSEQQVLIERK